MSSPISKLPATVAKSGVSLDLGMLARVRFDGGSAAERTFIAQRIAELWNLGALNDFTHLKAAPAAVRLVLLLEQHAVTMPLGDWLFHLFCDAGGRLSQAAHGRFSQAAYDEFNELHRQVKAALEGRS